MSENSVEKAAGLEPPQAPEIVEAREREEPEREAKRIKLDEGEDEGGDEDGDKGREGKFSKKKVALLLGYSGTNYCGMQVNPGVKTIESELFDAMIKAGAVSAANSIDAKKIHLVRAARTDKGVHAAGQLVAAKLLMVPNVVEEINKFLPEDIKVFGMRKVTANFHAKNYCDARVYEYCIPTYLFRKQKIDEESLKKIEEYLKSPQKLDEVQPGPRTQNPAAPKKHQQKNKKGKGSKGSGDEDEDSDEGGDEEEEGDEAVDVADTPEQMKERLDYRMSPEEFAYLGEVMKKFEGTFNYHNFTSKKKFSDPAAKRFVIWFKPCQPKVFNGLEWVSLRVKGQSFMFHQIRKMVGLTVAIMRTGSSPDTIRACFSSEKKHIPIAPGAGLFLETINYDFYNSRQAKEKRPPLEFDAEQPAVAAFKEAQIFPMVMASEEKRKSFLSWVHHFDFYLFERFKFLFRLRAPEPEAAS